MSGFFDQYPEFYATSTTTASPARLNYRHHLIVEQNLDLLRGRNVIDFASHDGRWSFAALKAGAQSTYGVEPRKHLVENANKTFAHYELPPSSYTFACNDGFDELMKLEKEARRFDTGLVLGFLYHTVRQYELIERLSRLGCSALVIDTKVLRNVKRQIVRLSLEDTSSESNIFATGKAKDLIAIPSVAATRLMLRAAGYQSRVVESAGQIPEGAGQDYRTGGRFTIVGTRT